MLKEKILLELIDSIYEAAVAPEKFTDFLSLLAKAVHSEWAALLAHDTVLWRFSIEMSVGADESVLARDRQYAEVNPFILRSGAFMQPSTVVTGEMIIPDAELVKTEFYNDHFRPSDMHHVISGTITCNSHSAALVNCVRSKKKGPFTAAEVELFRALDPHLRRALAIQMRMGEQAGYLDALDRIPNGCILLGKGGKVVALNRAAEQILAERDGLLYTNGRIDAPLPDSSSRLRELISSATSDLYQARPGGITAVQRPSGAHPYTALALPLTRKSPDWGGVYPVAVLFISDPACAQVHEDTVMELYRLTPAEARLARALAGGEGLGQAAEKLEIGINTAKTHLQRIFSKTQTNRQAELVRLLASAAATAGCLQVAARKRSCPPPTPSA